MKKKIGTILLVAGVLTCAYGLLFELALTLVYGVCTGLFGSLSFLITASAPSPGHYSRVA